MKNGRFREEAFLVTRNVNNHIINSQKRLVKLGEHATLVFLKAFKSTDLFLLSGALRMSCCEQCAVVPGSAAGATGEPLTSP